MILKSWHWFLCPTKQFLWHSVPNIMTLISWHWGIDILVKVNFWWRLRKIVTTKKNYCSIKLNHQYRMQTLIISSKFRSWDRSFVTKQNHGVHPMELWPVVIQWFDTCADIYHTFHKTWINQFTQKNNKKKLVVITQSWYERQPLWNWRMFL